MVHYRDADEWRKVAMERPDGVDAAEAARRRDISSQHYALTGSEPDPDAMADHELYIRGKMELDEYQAYLAFKHGQSKIDG